MSKIKAEYGSINLFLKNNDFGFILYKWIKCGEFPLYELKRILNKLDLNKIDLEREIIYIRSGVYPIKNGGGNLSVPIKARFPIYISEEIARIIAHLFADGCICLDKNNYLTGAYYNQSTTLRKEFRQDISKVFNFKNLKERVNKTTPYFYLPSPISLILLKIIPTFNSKKCRVPSFILNSNSKIKKEFLGAFFDDEAYVRFCPPYRYIELTINNMELLHEIKQLLSEMGIKTTDILERKMRGFDIFSFYIRGHENLRLFNEQIGFSDASKSKKIKKILNHPGRIYYLHGEIGQKILFLLSNRKINTLELSRLLKRSYSNVLFALNRLKQRGKVYNKIINHKRFWISK